MYTCKQAEAMTEYFNRMIHSCNKKCVVKFNEPDLQVGEMSCVDRCVGKYMQAQERVAEVLQNFEKQMVCWNKYSSYFFLLFYNDHIVTHSIVAFIMSLLQDYYTNTFNITIITIHQQAQEKAQQQAAQQMGRILPK